MFAITISICPRNSRKLLKTPVRIVSSGLRLESETYSLQSTNIKHMEGEIQACEVRMTLIEV